MTDYRVLAGEIAGLLFLAAFVPYFVQTLRGKARPNRVSWAIWTLLGVLILASYRAVGAENTIWVAVAAAIGPFAVLLLALRNGQGGAGRLDLCCLLAAFAGIGIWAATSDPLLGLLCFLGADVMGAVPTIAKVWRDPDSEPLPAWLLWFAGSAFQLVAIERWTVALALFPAYFFTGQIMIIALMLLRRRRAELRRNDTAVPH